MRIYHHQDPRKMMMIVAFSMGEGRFNQVYNFTTKEAFTVEQGNDLPPECYMEIPIDVWKSMLKEFAEIASGEGIKLDSDLKREGLLEATKFHLEDMRKLVFKIK